MNEIIGRYLQTKERIALEMIVLNSDKNEAVDFLSGYGLKIKDSEAIIYCKKWLKNIKKWVSSYLVVDFSAIIRVIYLLVK